MTESGTLPEYMRPDRVEIDRGPGRSYHTRRGDDAPESLKGRIDENLVAARLDLFFAPVYSGIHHSSDIGRGLGSLAPRSGEERRCGADFSGRDGFATNLRSRF